MPAAPLWMASDAAVWQDACRSKKPTKRKSRKPHSPFVRRPCARVMAAGLNRPFAGGSTSDTAALRGEALKGIAPFPDEMPGAELNSAAQAALGRRLYSEKRFPQNESQSGHSLQIVVDNIRRTITLYKQGQPCELPVQCRERLYTALRER